MNYKGVLFDFDGTLVASMEEHFKGWKYALNYFGKSLEPLDLFVLEGQGVSKVGLQLLQKNDIPLSNLDLVLKMKKEYFQNNNNVQVYPGAIEVLKWLMNNEVEVGLVTGGDRKRVNCFLEKNEMNEYFKIVVTSDDVQHTKPDPEPFIKGVNGLKVNPANCIVVENAPLGIKAAKTAGCFCVALTTTLPEKYLNEADIIVPDYKKLSEFLKF